MPVPVLAVAVGTSLAKRAFGFLARKVTKKLAKKAIIAGAGAVAIDKVLTSGAGGGGIKFPGKLSPFEPGRGIFGKSGGAGRVEAGENGACPAGYHLNKHPLQDGTAPRSVCVRNRSINYANGRAAKRAGRRLRGTVKMLKRSFTMVSARPPKGKFIPKRK